VGVILDTAVLIAAERGTFDMAGYLDALGDDPVALAAISASELLHGVERARDPAVRRARSDFVEGVLANVPVIPFGLAEARVHARIWATLAAAGTPIGAHDLQVAATALVAGSAVATLDDAEFSRVPALAIAPLAGYVRR
jgi:tRNA(fMet)-specific endonuclease VapC